MTNRSFASLCLFFSLLPFASAQNATSANLQASCAHWAKLRLDKHKQFKGESDDLYETGQCVGYFVGLLDGMDNTGGWQLSDGSVRVFQIKRSEIRSTWDVIRAFYAYVDANPLEKGKPAWTVLQRVLTANGLASFVPQASQPQTQASTLSKECRTGATNVLTEFNSDTDLKTIDTPTLMSALNKLVGCWNTPGISDADTILVLSATSEAEIVLESRAENVLRRHALLPEFGAERSGSPTQNRNVSNVHGETTEQ